MRPAGGDRPPTPSWFERLAQPRRDDEDESPEVSVSGPERAAPQDETPAQTAPRATVAVGTTETDRAATTENADSTEDAATTARLMPGATDDADTDDADTDDADTDDSDADDADTDQAGTDTSDRDQNAAIEAGADAVAADAPAARADEPIADDAPAPPPRPKQVITVPGVPRYHDEDCILIRFMDEEDLQKMTVPEAAESGCTPCRVCQLDPDGG